MFYNIINNEPQWQPHFSAAATQILKGQVELSSISVNPIHHSRVASRRM
jgi:hypothetical protein